MTEGIEGLIRELDALEDGPARTAAHALVQSLMDLHADAFERLVSMCDPQLVRRFASDELLGSLLLLYGLHPEPVERRVEAALDKVRPYLRSHGGSVQLVEVEDGIVHLRLDGTCHDCPSSALTLKLAVEEAIFEAAPEVRQVVAAGVAEPRGRELVPCVPSGAAAASAAGRVSAAEAAAAPPVSFLTENA